MNLNKLEALLGVVSDAQVVVKRWGLVCACRVTPGDLSEELCHAHLVACDDTLAAFEALHEAANADEILASQTGALMLAAEHTFRAYRFAREDCPRESLAAIEEAERVVEPVYREAYVRDSWLRGAGAIR